MSSKPVILIIVRAYLKSFGVLVNNFLGPIVQIGYFYAQSSIAGYQSLVGANDNGGTKRPDGYCCLVRFLSHYLGPRPLSTLHYDVVGAEMVRGEDRTYNTDMRVGTYSEFCSSGLGGRFTGSGGQKAGVRRILSR